MNKILVCFLIYSQFALALNPGDSPVDLTKQDLAWSKLIHYQKTDSNNWKRLIQSSNFYLSVIHSPEAEWKENLKAFTDNPRYPCLFPARAEYISKLTGLRYKKCPEVFDRLSRINSKRLHLVYVAQYVSNPASVFGHTFFLFEDPEKPLLLNTTINNAAAMPSEIGPYDYIVKGLSGGFPGKYTLEPFIVKMKEYNHIENRDMWKYELNLSQDEIKNVLNHIWELSESDPESYRFLDRNCSVSIYNALAATRSDLEFIVDEVYILPIETLNLSQKLILSSTYVPSYRTMLNHKVLSSTSKVKLEFQSLIKKHQTPLDYVSTEALDLALDYFEFEKTSFAGQLLPKNQAYYDTLLETRAERGGRIEWPTVINPANPLEAKPPKRISLKHQVNQKSLKMQLSPFSHELLDSEAGYLPFSEVVVLDFHLTSTNEKIYLSEFDVFKLSLFQESSSFDFQPSWELQLGARFDQFQNFQSHSVEATYGLSKAFTRGGLFYSLVGILSEQRTWPEVKFGHLWRFKSLSLHSSLMYQYDSQLPFEESGVLNFESRYNLNQQSNVGYKFSARSQETNHNLAFNLFFE